MNYDQMTKDSYIKLATEMINDGNTIRQSMLMIAKLGERYRQHIKSDLESPQALEIKAELERKFPTKVEISELIKRSNAS